MEAEQTPGTLGRQLDAALSVLDDLPPTQLYALIVGATVLISFVLLGTNSNPLPTASPQQRAASEKKNNKAATRPHAGPEPRWHIFQWVNVVFSALFLWSVAEFGLHADLYTGNNSTTLWLFLASWSVFLCYFFGFFGVSFVHQELQQPTQNKKETGESEETAAASVTGSSVSSESKNNRTRADSLTAPSKSQKSKLHPPAASAPVCSDPSSFSTTPALVTDVAALDNAQIAQLVGTNKLKDHELEKRLEPARAVQVRRLVVQEKLRALQNDAIPSSALAALPSEPSLDYGRVHGANCEIVVGYVPLPVGLVGPLLLNGESVYIPMATTEGCLVASTNRGAKAISQGLLGAQAVVVRDGITRAPCIRMPTAMQACQLKLWCERPENLARLKQAFESTTSFGKLQACQPTVAGKNVYLRLQCFSGDAMGMNMVSKGSLAVIETLKQEFPCLVLVALSGNMCTDKKAAAVNWIEGRGKSVVVEAVIPQQVVHSTLKTDVQSMVETNTHKNLIGSAMAGVMGGFNAHASNIVTAVFLATGQDPAQNVESSNCITLLEETPEGDLWISCTMPSVEVGTVGGGTSLEAQSACLAAMGCQGGCSTTPGDNARKLATIVAAATLAGELSLLAALAANTLVQAHMQHNRKKK